MPGLHDMRVPEIGVAAMAALRPEKGPWHAEIRPTFSRYARLGGEVGRCKPMILKHPSNRPTSSNLQPPRTRPRCAHAHPRARAHTRRLLLSLDEVGRLDVAFVFSALERPTFPSDLKPASRLDG